MKSKSKKVQPNDPAPPKKKSGRNVHYIAHTINVLIPLDDRIERIMKLEGINNFTAWANAAFTQRCQRTEAAHKIDAEGNPLPPAPEK